MANHHGWALSCGWGVLRIPGGAACTNANFSSTFPHERSPGSLWPVASSRPWRRLLPTYIVAPPPAYSSLYLSFLFSGGRRRARPRRERKLPASATVGDDRPVSSGGLDADLADEGIDDSRPIVWLEALGVKLRARAQRGSSRHRETSFYTGLPASMSITSGTRSGHRRLVVSVLRPYHALPSLAALFTRPQDSDEDIKLRQYVRR